MKKFFVCSVFITNLIIFCMPLSFAYSSGFLYMIDAIGIERLNVNGFEINEEIYEKYNLIVYGDPVKINYEKQRWKDVENGKWSNAGIRGEYWILGQDYSGKLIHNELFPDDYNSGTSPLNWNYRIVKDAEESWNDTTLYMYEAQREYMLTQKLSRFGITYDLTALDIGLDKAKVENYATWGNAGSIYTEKPGEGNVYWAATFNIPPMAADANLNSILNFPNGLEYTIQKDEDSIEIFYEYGAEIVGLSDYAKAEHIKIIETEVKINGIRNGIVSDSETIKIAQKGSFVINRNDYPNIDKIVLNFESNSFANTYFPNDSIMYSTNAKTVIINIENEEKIKNAIINDENAPVIYSINVKRVSTDEKGNLKYVDLYKNIKTKEEFVCAGQIIRIEVKTSLTASNVTFAFNGGSSISMLDKTTKRFLWDEPSERNEKSLYSSLRELENYYDLPRRLELKDETETYKVFVGTYVIPYETTQTLHSWSSLRNESKNAFDIDESKLFTSKGTPYRLVIKASSYMGTRTKTQALDVAERWDVLFNRDISKYIK